LYMHRIAPSRLCALTQVPGNHRVCA
jgi:hypothetical protein